MKLSISIKDKFGFIILAVFFYMYTVGRVYGFERAYYPVFFVALAFALKEFFADMSCLAKYSQWFKWQLSFILLQFVSIIWSPHPDAFDYWVSSLVIVLKIVTVAIICRKDDGLENLFYTLALTGLAVFVTLLLTNNLYAYRASGIEFVDNMNCFGFICDIFALGAYFSIIQVRSKFWKVSFLVILIADIYMMMMTGGRKFLIFVFVLVFTHYYFNSSKAKLNHIIIVGIIATVALFVLHYLIMNIGVLYEAIGYRFDGQLEGEDDQKELMNLALHQFYEHPIFGLGISGFQAVNWTHMYSHSNYTELLANFGLVGTFLYYSQHIYCIWTLRKYRLQNTHRAAVILSIFLAIVAIDMFAITFNQSAFIPLLIMLGSGYCYELKRQNGYV